MPDNDLQATVIKLVNIIYLIRTYERKCQSDNNLGIQIVVNIISIIRTNQNAWNHPAFQLFSWSNLITRGPTSTYETF